MNHFELFNLSPAFNLDPAQLAKTNQTLQLLTHPDKFATAGERDKRIALQKNAQVNDAYQVLKSPLRRAEHMLELRGVELKHEQQTMQDGMFLMQQMQWREQLEEVDSTADPLSELDGLDMEIEQHIQQHLVQLESLLFEHSASSDDAGANVVRKLKFFYKLKNEIAIKEDALSDF